MEKKRKMIYAAAGVAVLIAVIAAVVYVAAGGRRKEDPAGGKTENPVESGAENPQENPAAGQDGQGAGEGPEEYVTTAMYIPIAKEVYLLVDQDNGAVFTANFPEELYDIDGEKTAREQLKKGNILKIYGNGIMLESWPGQYPGVTRMEVVEEGDPSDADQYKELVDEYYQEPDPAEPPSLNLEYTTEQAKVASMVNRGGYEWTYLDKDGTSNSVVADSLPVLLWKDELLNDVRLGGPLDLYLVFSEEPVEVTAVRWPADMRGSDGQTADGGLPDGEPVEVTEKDEKPVIEKAEPGYVYGITAVWENGRAEFGFLTAAQ